MSVTWDVIAEIITGGQTGADQAGWRAAARFGLPTRGFMPRGFLTEAGPRPEFAALYHAVAAASAYYSDRTRANVAVAHALLWFGDDSSPGGGLTTRTFSDTRPPAWDFQVVLRRPVRGAAADLVRRAAQSLGHPLAVLVAGNRESRHPGIGARVEEYLCGEFRALGLAEIPTPAAAT